LRIDRILRRQSTWPEPTTLESIDPTREEEYLNNRERHHIKGHNTYFRGYNKTPGGNMGKPPQLWKIFTRAQQSNDSYTKEIFATTGYSGTIASDI